MKKWGLNLLVCLSVCFLFISGCFEEMSPTGSIVIYVDDDNIDGPWDGTQEYPYQDIQDGIDAAVDDSIIFVSNGTYHEILVINKSIDLVGFNKNNTTISYDENKIGHIDIVLFNVNNCTIKGFNIVNTNFSKDVTGININDTSNINISNVIISYSHRGISIGFKSTNNHVFQNTITNNEFGIDMEKYASHNYISNNIIAANTQYGIFLQGGSKYNIISWNNISDNQCGVRLKSSTNNNIFGNTVINNQQGMYFCCGARVNTVFYNEFINNGWNAKDTELNAWNNETVGNYWDNYKGIDSDSDGISETYYSIPGGNNRDNHPLMDPGLK